MYLLTDHLPYFIFLDYLEPKRVDATKSIRIQTWNTESINKFKLEINNAGICYMLNTTNHANPNDNLNTLNEVISKAKDKHLPVCMIKFS